MKYVRISSLSDMTSGDRSVLISLMIVGMPVAFDRKKAMRRASNFVIGFRRSISGGGRLVAQVFLL